MRMSVVLYDGFTALDVVGGYEVLANVPGMEVELVAAQEGLVAADTRRLGLPAYRGFDEVEDTDILYVPGGPGVVTALQDPGLLGWLARIQKTASWTVGICNGVALLAAAGALDGRRVTTNWSWRERVAAYGVEVVEDRFHRDGSVVTGAGVSASIDASLYLAGQLGGDDLARPALRHGADRRGAVMSVDTLVQRNALASDALTARGGSLVPGLDVVVLTCADHRVDPAHVLGLGHGDAVVLRNPGGRVTPDAIRSLLVLGTVAAIEDLGTDFQVVVMHHTDCGLSRLSGPEHARLLGEFAGVEPTAVEALHVTDPVLSVQHDVAILDGLGIPAVGLVYDIATGLVRKHAG